MFARLIPTLLSRRAGGGGVRLSGASALALSACLLAPAALAQQGESPDIVIAPAGGVSAPVEAGAPRERTDPAFVAQPRPDVDESALRYYASQGDKKRVEAEARRLRALHPGWSVPGDLYNTNAESAPDEQALWELFAADRMEELRIAIEARRQAEPGWEPSSDLASKIKRKETREKVLALWNDKKWKELVQFAIAEPSVAEIGDAEVLWTLAEGFANTRQRTEALGLYRAILGTTQDVGERNGTIQKAMANLPMSDVEQLIALGKKDRDGNNEFNAMIVDITRARISAFLHDERREEVPPDDVKIFEDYARAIEDPNQPGLIAWYRYKRKEFTQALEWFKYALSRGGDAMIAHGLAHSLRELGQYRETEEVAYAWRNYLVNNRILYVDILETDLTKAIPPYIEPERLARFGRVVVEDASGEGAQALAWYAFNSCQYEVALEWFERAVAWMPKADTVYGYALALRKLKRDKAFVEVVNRADGLFPKVLTTLFADEFIGPPPACEITSWQEAQWWEQVRPQLAYLTQQTNAAQQFDAAGGAGGVRNGVAPIERHGSGPYTAGYTGFVQNALHDPLMRYSWGQVTSPTGKVHPQYVPPVVAFSPPASFQNAVEIPARDVFPVAVLPENPLRFAAQGQPAANPVLAAAKPAAAPAPYARDPYQGPYPVIARKVNGVEAMPYEKFGLVPLANPAPGQPMDPAAFLLPYAPAEPETPAGRSRRNAQANDLTASLRQNAFASGAVSPVQMAQGSQQPIPPMPQPYAMPGGARPGAPLPMQAVHGSAYYAPTPPSALPQAGQAQPAQTQPAQVMAALPAVTRAEPAALVATSARTTLTRPAARKAAAAAPAGRACSLGGINAASPAAAVNTGWCLLNAGRPAEAAIAFERGMQGSGKSAEDAAYGRSLALLQQNEPERAVAVAREGDLTPARRREIGLMTSEQLIFQTYQKGDYLGTLAQLERRLPHAPETRDLSIMRAWSLFNLGRIDQAEKLFRLLDGQTSTRESRSGLAAVESRRLGNLQ